MSFATYAGVNPPPPTPMTYSNTWPQVQITTIELSEHVFRNKKVFLVADPCYPCRAPKSDIMQAVLDQEKRLITYLAIDSGCVLAIAQAGASAVAGATSLTRSSERDGAANFTLGNFGISEETAATRTRVKSW